MKARSLTNEQLLDTLRWRYATKRFDAKQRIAEEDWRTLEQALVLSPSSLGLQPWKFILVENPAVRAQLLPATWNQRQVVDCSHYVVFAIRKDIGDTHVDAHLNRIVQVRGVAPEKLAPLRAMISEQLLKERNAGRLDDWAGRQVYIALANLMTCAALMGIDTCPIEGLEPATYDRILDLPRRGLATVVACAAGYRDNGDKYGGFTKVRFPTEDIVERI